MDPNIEHSLCRITSRFQSTIRSYGNHNPIKCNVLGFTLINSSQPRIGAILSHWYLREFLHWLQKLTKATQICQAKPGVCSSDTVSKYLAEEIVHHWVTGPFKRLIIPVAHISRFGVTSPKTISKQMAPNHRSFPPSQQKCQ